MLRPVSYGRANSLFMQKHGSFEDFLDLSKDEKMKDVHFFAVMEEKYAYRRVCTTH